MKKRLYTLATLALLPLLLFAQPQLQLESADGFLKEGRRLFNQNDYQAAETYLEKWQDLTKQQNGTEARDEEVEYMLLVIDAEADLSAAAGAVSEYMMRYPRSIYTNRLNSLMAASYYAQGEFENAVLWYQKTSIEKLTMKDVVRATYYYMVSSLKTGDIETAKQQMSILKIIDKDTYSDEIVFYDAYMDYIQSDYEKAKEGFSISRGLSGFANESNLYLAEIALMQGDYTTAADVAALLLESDASESVLLESERIMGESMFMLEQYEDAFQFLSSYVMSSDAVEPQDLYYLGVAAYMSKDYDAAVEYLPQVTGGQDVMSQNALLYEGMAYLKKNDKVKARLAFEQASSMPGNDKIREQALYNYALIIHETSYSPFAESVTVFERFLNEYPKSRYADNVNSYLLDVYMNTTSYDAALASIAKINNPGRSILEAKQQLLYKKAMDLYANAKYADAAQMFGSAIEYMDLNRSLATDAYFWRAESYYRSGNVSRAESDYSRYISLAPGKNTRNYVLSRYGLGYINYNQEKYANALDNFTEMLNRVSVVKMPDNLVADACIRVADCHFYMRSLDKATDYYNAAINMNSAMSDYVLYQKGLVSGLQHNYNEKVTSMERLVADYPASTYVPLALYEAGRAYRQMDNTTNAIKVFNKIVSDYPQSDLARVASTEIAQIYYQVEDYSKAISAYKHVVDRFPGSDEARLAMRDLRSIYVEQGDVNSFLRYSESVQGVAPIEMGERDSLSYASAELMYSRADYKNALNLFRQYLEEFPQGAYAVNAWYYQAVIYQNDNDYENALDCYEKCASYENSRFCEESLNQAASMAFTIGDYKSALNNYKRLADRTVDINKRRNSYIGVVKSAMQVSDYNTLLAYVDKAVDLAQTELERNELLCHKAKALLLVDRQDEALKLYEQLSADPRTAYGAESDYMVSLILYNKGELAAAEKNIMELIQTGTSHSFWLANSFIVLADIYMAQGKTIEARQYLLSLQRNYTIKGDDIPERIEERLSKIEE